LKSGSRADYSSEIGKGSAAHLASFPLPGLAAHACSLVASAVDHKWDRGLRRCNYYWRSLENITALYMPVVSSELYTLSRGRQPKCLISQLTVRRETVQDFRWRRSTHVRGPCASTKIRSSLAVAALHKDNTATLDVTALWPVQPLTVTASSKSCKVPF